MQTGIWYIPINVCNLSLYQICMLFSDSHYRVSHIIRQHKSLAAIYSAPWFLKIKVLINQVLFQTLEKFQFLYTCFFFSAPEFFSGLWYKSEKNPVDKLKKIQVYWKKIQVCRTWNFSKVWNRPYFFKTLIFRNEGAD